MKSLVGLRYVVQAGRAKIALLWVLGLCTVVLQLVTPAQVGRLTNLFQRGPTQPPAWSQINTALAWLLGAQLVIALLTFWQRRSHIRFEQAVVKSLAGDMFARLLRFSADFFRDHKAETINTRTLDDSKVVAVFWSDAMVAVPLAVLALVVFGAYMLSTNWFLGVCLIPLSLMSGYFLFFDRLIQRLNRSIRETWDEVRVRSHEVIAGVAEIRNHGAFGYGQGAFERSFGGYTDLMKSVGTWNAFFRAASPLVGAVQTGALYWLGAGLCLSGSWLTGLAGEMTWGDVVGFMLIAGLFRDPVQTLAGFLLDWRMAHENLRRVAEYLEQPLVFVDRLGAPLVEEIPAGIVFDRVDVVAEGGARILQALDAALEPGRHVALVGPAGCGKSTAMQLIVRGVTPASGRLLFGGRNVAEYDIFSLAARIGFVPQSPILFDTTLRQNLLLGLRRPGRVRLTDDDGELDVTHLPGVTSLADLDRKLVEVLRLASFERDVLTKALDNCLPPGARGEELRRRVPDLRGGVAAAVTALPQGLIVPLPADPGDAQGTCREDLSLRENLLLGRVDSQSYRATESVDAAIREAALRAGVLDQILLAGLEYRAGENGKFLSGGQRQKVALARVLLKNPSILLLDEATASLDEISQAAIVESLRRAFQGKTVVAISHRLATITHYDEVLVLDRGQMIERGQPARLAMLPGLFGELAARESGERVPRGPASAEPIPAGEISADDTARRALSRSELFGDLQSAHLAAIERTSRVLACPAGVTLFRRGDQGDELYLVCEGQIEFLGQAGAAESPSDAEIVETFGPGQAFGELGLLGDIPRTLTARTKTAARFLVITRDQLLESIHADPEIAVAMLRTLSRRIAALRDEKYGPAA